MILHVVNAPSPKLARKPSIVRYSRGNVRGIISTSSSTLKGSRSVSLGCCPCEAVLPPPSPSALSPAMPPLLSPKLSPRLPLRSPSLGYLETNDDFRGST